MYVGRVNESKKCQRPYPCRYLSQWNGGPLPSLDQGVLEQSRRALRRFVPHYATEGRADPSGDVASALDSRFRQNRSFNNRVRIGSSPLSDSDPGSTRDPVRESKRPVPRIPYRIDSLEENHPYAIRQVRTVWRSRAERERLSAELRPHGGFGRAVATGESLHYLGSRAISSASGEASNTGEWRRDGPPGPCSKVAVLCRSGDCNRAPTHECTPEIAPTLGEFRRTAANANPLG